MNSTDVKTLGLRWFTNAEVLRKQRSIIGNSYPLILAAAAINYTYLYNGIVNETATIEWIGSVSILVALMWYIGAVIGSIIGGFNRYPWSTLMTNYICGCLLLIAGILLCVREMFLQNIHVLTCVARFLAGLTFGFLIPVVSAQIGDNGWKMTRGYIVSLIPKSIIGGLFIAILFNERTWESSITEYHLILYFVIIGVSAYVIVMTYRHGGSESITRLLQQKATTEAETTFKNFLDADTDPEIIQSEMNDKHEMMSEDYQIVDQSYLHVFNNGNFKPIFWMILLRLLGVLTMNIYFLKYSGESIANHFDQTHPTQIHFFSVFFRFVGLILSRFVLDISGRRYPYLISGIGSGLSFGLLILGIGIESNRMVKVSMFLIFVFASFGIDSMQYLYAVEAFPLSKRNASIAIISCFEYIAHAAIIILWFSNCERVLQCMIIASPVIIIVSTILLFLNLPETKWKSLRQCRAEFNNFYQSVPIQSQNAEI